ncbi:multifunctional CCA addition/repair protein [Aquincola sp. MAHUQ-54]|uniref:Multifunctional CCA protein n=1 Tax=Aquincola agrisoli TaxID=3119538 RepID=A0AAW9QGC9_9BURK
MRIYGVGGAVRDRLLREQAGQPDGPHEGDRDWVVVGATAEQLGALGYVPVGRDFPVFLHPQTREEYALARTERKSAPGYRGFVMHADPSVTLEEDLQRRDLTVNAIAEAEDGTLIDPFGGRQDLAARVLRHVSGAFAEDPVRILRLARFAARWPDFSVAPETMALAGRMVADGEVDALVPERVWQELSRGLMEARPSRMFEVLRACGALQRLLPEVDRLWGVPQPPQHHPEVDTGVHVMLVVDMAARLHAPLPARFACLVHDLGKGSTPPEEWPRHIAHEARSVKLVQRLCERLRVPAECRELGEVTAREHGNVHRSAELNAAAVMRLLERCDALRRPERFAQMLLACECDARGRTGFEDAPYPQRARLLKALSIVQGVDAQAASAAAAARGLRGPAVGEAVREARTAALAAGLDAGTDC